MADTLHYNPVRASKVPDNALTLLIRRLEAATSRLEDIATSATGVEQTNGITDSPRSAPAAVPSSSSAPDLSGLAKDAQQQSTSTPSNSAAHALPPTVSDMDDLMKEDLEKFIGASKGLDNTIADQVGAV